MPPRHPTLLLTRPEAASRRFAAEVRARFGPDWPILIAPLMQTEWLRPVVDPRPFTGLIFTSETAVAGFCQLTERRDLPAYCVGARTAGAARLAGFPVRVGPGDAPGLVALILRDGAPGPLCWPHGQDVALDIAEMLKKAGTETVSVVIYRQSATPLTAEAAGRLALDEPLLLPLFSARSARLFGSARPARTAPLFIAALSEAVAEAARPLGARALCVARRPDSGSLLDCIDQLSQRIGDG